MGEKDNHNDQIREEVRVLDGILPEDVDRRKFLGSTVAAIMTGGLAGCAGGGGGGGGSDGGDSEDTATPTPQPQQTPTAQPSSDSGNEVIQKNVLWRQNWSAQANYTVEFIAPIKGFYQEQSITPPKVRRGFGSGDAAKRIGLGPDQDRAAMGMSSSTSVINAMAKDGLNLKVHNVATQQNSWSLNYRTDLMPDGRDSISGKKVLVASAAGKVAWELYANATGVIDLVESGDVQVQFGSQGPGPALLAKGDVDAVFNTLNNHPLYEREVKKQTDAEVEIDNTAQHATAQGYYHIVNADWLADEPDATEYLSRIITGWSNASKWAHLNPEAAIDVMIEQINPEMKTTPKELLLQVFRAFPMALNMTSGVKENGLGYLDKEATSEYMGSVADILDIDLPDHETLGAWEAASNAEYATFSSDEWNQVKEFTGRYGELFS